MRNCTIPELMPKHRLKRSLLTGLTVFLLVFCTVLTSGTAESMPSDYAGIWARHWVKEDEPRSELTITRNPDGTLHMDASFEQVLTFGADLIPYDYEIIEFEESTGLISGYLVIQQADSGSLFLSVTDGSVLEDSSLYDYFLYNAFIYTTDDPPDLTEYGWEPEYPPEEEEWEAIGEARRQELFGALSHVSMLAASGTGAWEGHLKIDSSGRFTGDYYDADNDEVSQVSFSGVFGNVYRFGDTEYYLEVASAFTLLPPGAKIQGQYGEQITYIDTLFPKGSGWYLTLPGTPDDDIPETVKAEIGGTMGDWDDYSGYYTLTRDYDGWGFFADSPVRQPDPTPIIETATPAPAATKKPAAMPGTKDFRKYTTAMPNGNLFYDDGVFAFEAPADIQVVIPAVTAPSVKGLTIFMPRPADYNARLAERNPGSSADALPNDPLQAVTIRLAAVQSTYWQNIDLKDFDAEALAQHMYKNYAKYIGGKPNWYGATALKNGTAYYIRRDSSPSSLTPGARSDYFVQLSGDRVLWIITDDSDDAAIRSAADLILHTLVIKDSETVQTTAAPVPLPATAAVTPPPTPPPAQTPVSDTDWDGLWTVTRGSRQSQLYIHESPDDIRMAVTFDGIYSFFGSLEMEDSSTADFSTDDFNCMLTLNREKGTILMSEIGSMVDGVNDWMDEFGFMVEYRPVNAGQPQPTATAVPVRVTPQATATRMRTPAPTAQKPATQTPRVRISPAPTEQAKTYPPVAGHPGYLQVPVYRVDATSYIEGNDPTAYIPYRMIDGDETTAYQFSTRTSRLGKTYLYFDFEDPVALDELWIKNGFWKYTDGLDQYTRNSRVKKMTVEFRYAGSSTYRDAKSVTLKDDKSRRDWSAVKLAKSGVTGVRIRIDSIYQGTKYKNDVCISEVMFVQITGKR